MRKKNVYEVEMCDDQLRFFLLLILLSRRPKSWIFSSSPIFDKSQISLFSWALVLDLHRLHDLMGRTLSLLRLECSREEECLVRAKNFSARNPQLFSFSSLLTEVPKNRSHPRLIQEYFFLSLLLLPMTRVNPIELFFCGQFCLLLIEQKSLRQSRLPDGTICMKRCRRVGNSGEKVWLW